MKRTKNLLLKTKSGNFWLKEALLMLFVVLIAASASAQSVEPTIKNIMDNLRFSRSESVNTSNLYVAANVPATLKALIPYYSDSLYTIRAEAFTIASVAGRKSATPAVRKEAVNRLLRGCSDKESSIIGIASKALQSFNPEDFDAKARQQVKTLLNNPVAYLNNIAQLAGYIGEKEYEPLLLDLFNNPKTSKRDKFAIQLALARMGDSEMLDKLLSRIKSLPVNDDVIYEAGPALAYVRQKQGVDYLFDIILSNARSCESANPDSNTKILCAYRALEFVAPVVKDFPLKLDVSGDLDVDNYEEALKTARTWILAHKDDYEVERNSF